MKSLQQQWQSIEGGKSPIVRPFAKSRARIAMKSIKEMLGYVSPEEGEGTFQSVVTCKWPHSRVPPEVPGICLVLHLVYAI